MYGQATLIVCTTHAPAYNEELLKKKGGGGGGRRKMEGAGREGGVKVTRSPPPLRIQ